MKPFPKAMLLAVLAIVILYSSANPQSAPVKSDLTLQKDLTALSGIFVIVLLVERTTEIVIAIWRQALTDRAKKEIEGLSNNPGAKAEKEQQLAEYKAETKGLSLLTGFTLAAVVCAAGIGLLGENIDISRGNPHFLRAVDIVLTWGLIAGGSDSFHQFTSALDVYFNESKENMENPKKE